MHALFTEHAAKHYLYLRDTMPHLVPRLTPALTKRLGIGKEEIEDEESRDRRGREFLERMVTGIERAKPGGKVYTQLLEAASVDVERLAEMDRQMEGAATFTALYIKCLLLIRSIIKDFSQSPLPTSTSKSNTSSNISLLLQHAQKYVK